MRRTTVLAAAATAVALAALTACNDTENKDAAAPAPATTAATAPATTAAAPSPTATEILTPTPAVTTPAPAVTTPAGDFDPAKAVENASKEPYAVTIKTTMALGGKPAGTMTARMNLNTVYTSRSEMTVVEADAVIETVITTDAAYSRMGPDDKWTKVSRPADASAADYTEYAKLLLALGPSARKGAEIRDGVPTQHLSGRIEVEQLATIDPSVYRNTKAKGVTGFDFDQWVDAQGRTRYAEQVVLLKGSKNVNKMTFTDFGPAETFAAPAGAGAAAG
ncbi:LppX_LprAFG lipoprotein [Kitasatospora purpeofusca]|uniref:LppX_LprAFG lipoprotein n=1 Tax=Kitasatospora purpeofusca TaxID=67352 RepID=UPI0035E0157D